MSTLEMSKYSEWRERDNGVIKRTPAAGLWVSLTEQQEVSRIYPVGTSIMWKPQEVVSLSVGYFLPLKEEDFPNLTGFGTQYLFRRKALCFDKMQPIYISLKLS